MDGPRQGVHVSSQHLQQWRQMHRLIRWRAFKFRDPDESYIYRARIEPHPPQLPASDHKQHGSAFPSRGPLLKRPSSAGGTKYQRPSTAPSTTSPGRDTPTGVRTMSSTSLRSSPLRKMSIKGGQKESSSVGPTAQVSGSEFTLSATAMSIQPRQGTQRSQAAPKTNKQSIVNLATFPYPDPSKVKGHPGFVSRLAELARLEAETIRSEQAKARLMSRPTSARSIKSSVSSTSSKSNYQSGRRTSVNASTSRIPSAMRRLNSSPAVSGLTHKGVSYSSSFSTSGSVSKQLSSSDLQTRSRKLDSVEESPLKSESSAKESVKVKQSVGTDSESESQGERSTLRCTTDNTEDSGDDAKVQRSCSPPIVFIKIPQCSWTAGEGSNLEKAIPMIEENITDENEGEHKSSESESVGEDMKAGKDDSSSGVSSTETTQDSISNRNDGEGKCKSFMEDDLKVTSDLGLSIDSLHLSQEDNSDTTDVAISHTGKSSSGTDREPSSGMELKSDRPTYTEHSSTDKSIIFAPSADSKTEGDGEVDESNINPKKTKKKLSTSKRPTKLLNGSSSTAHVLSSSSSTSLKSSKSDGRNTQRLKKSSKKIK